MTIEESRSVDKVERLRVETSDLYHQVEVINSRLQELERAHVATLGSTGPEWIELTAYNGEKHVFQAAHIHCYGPTQVNANHASLVCVGDSEEMAYYIKETPDQIKALLEGKV